MNTAQTRGARERRTVPFSSLNGSDPDDDGALLDPDRFFSHDHALYPGHWALGPTRWQTPEEGLLAGETREVILERDRSSPAPPSTR